MLSKKLIVLNFLNISEMIFLIPVLDGCVCVWGGGGGGGGGEVGGGGVLA